MIDNNGVVRQHVVYDTYGRRIREVDYNSTGTLIASNNSAAIDTVFGYTGRDWDADIGMQYNRARWYDPSTGRWLSQDPIGFAGGDANLYRYVGNHPTMATDPSGLDEWWNDSGWDYVNPFAWSAWAGNGIGYGGAWAYYGPSNMACDVNMRHQTKVRIAQNMGRDNDVQGTGNASRMGETERQFTEGAVRINYEFQAAAAGMASPIRGAGSVPGSSASKVLDDWADDAFQVIKHGSNRPRPIGSQSHHGVMSAYMKANYAKYDADLAPGILMSRSNHQKTFGVFNTWYAAKSKAMGGKFDWKNVTECEIRELSEKMFDAASVPKNIRKEYWDGFEKMKKALTKEVSNS